jgi:hypothetical protein
VNPPTATYVDFRRLEEDCQLLIRLPPNIWLMDNHKWALVAWETHRAESHWKRAALMHADFHWDAADQFLDRPDAHAQLVAADLEALRAMTAADELIRYDSFIAPAVRRSLLSEVHFFCLQDDGDKGIDADLCQQFGAIQTLHPDVASLAAAKPAAPLIFDLCLDLFNRADKLYQSDLWTDEEVAMLLSTLHHHIRSAELVTVSMSFGYSGDEDDTRRLAELVVPKIVEMRQ